MLLHIMGVQNLYVTRHSFSETTWKYFTNLHKHILASHIWETAPDSPINRPQGSTYGRDTWSGRAQAYVENLCCGSTTTT